MNNPLTAITGFDKVKEKLTKLVEANRVPQALLFTGPETAPKRELAIAFAKILLKTEKNEHPDLHIYLPEGKVGLHSISTMRQFSDDVYLAPFESGKKVFIILDAERMLPTSANALLKTFEEPAIDTVIILVSSRPSNMLPTILSRCQKVRIEQGELTPVKNDPLHKLILDSASEGALHSYAKVLDLVDQVSSQLESEFKELENTLREEMIDPRSDQLTATQKESITKEIEGRVSLQKKARVKELFVTLQSWFRDLHLLRVKGNPALLIHPDYLQAMQAVSAQKKLPDLSEVESAIKDALIALERSTSPKICFENLFLRLI